MGLGGPAVLQQHTEVQVQYICLPSLGVVSAGVGTVSLAPTHTIPVPNPNWLSALNDKKGQKAQSLDKEVKMRDMRTTTCYSTYRYLLCQSIALEALSLFRLA